MAEEKENVKNLENTITDKITLACEKVEENINFDEETHTYKNKDDEILISATQLLEKQKISPSYENVNIQVLRKSADKGKVVHSEIEDYNKTGNIGFTKECLLYSNYIEEKELKCVASELRVFTDYYAGQLDELLLTPEGEIIIADNKTTSVLHKESVSWQLSLYAYALWVMTGIEINKGQAFWFHNEQLNVVDIPLKEREEVEALIKADKSGLLYQQKYPLEADKIAYMEDLKASQNELEAEIKKIKEELEKLAKELETSMIDNKMTTFDTGSAKFTLIIPNATDKFNLDKFKEENPEEYQKYLCKSEPKKNTLKNTLKKGK